MSTFKKDVSRGGVLEDAVRKKLEANGWHVTHVGGKFHYWDFAISKGSMCCKVEVKHDIKSDETGNYCIEHQWLKHTLASLLIIGTPKEAYMIPIDEVRKIVSGWKDVRDVGDQQLNFSSIIPKHLIINKAKRFL